MVVSPRDDQQGVVARYNTLWQGFQLQSPDLQQETLLTADRVGTREKRQVCLLGKEYSVKSLLQVADGDLFIPVRNSQGEFSGTYTMAAIPAPMSKVTEEG